MCKMRVSVYACSHTHTHTHTHTHNNSEVQKKEATFINAVCLFGVAIGDHLKVDHFAILEPAESGMIQ